MNDILLIGGPATLTGVDRISDDLVSILAEGNLFSRKAVIVWPTKDFLSLPAVLDSLQPYLDMDTVVWSAIESKGLMPSSDLTLKRIKELKAEACEDKKAIADAIVHSATPEAVYRLSQLILDVSGGLKLVVVVGDDAPAHALCWTRLVDSWKPSSQVDVKRYDTKSPCYGALNAVKDWGLEFSCLKPGSYQAKDLLPLGEINLSGRTCSIGADLYTDAPHALAKHVSVGYPVEIRSGNAKAVQVDAGDGFMLVVPEPDKPKNFRIGLMSGGSVKAEGESVEVAKKVAAKPRETGAANDEYVTVKEAAGILRCSSKSIRNYYGDGRLKYKKVGERKVLILKSSLDAFPK